MIQEFLSYYKKANMMQELKFEGGSWTKEDVNDDLVWNVPIYDVVNRRFAAFSSLLEAVKLNEKDPKGNGVYFKAIDGRFYEDDFMKLCYLFRLCGSGINYKPKQAGGTPFGTHGFGNFWVVDQLKNGFTDYQDWMRSLPQDKFCDVKGYLLPMIKGGLRNFILNEAEGLVTYLIDFMIKNRKVGIEDVVDEGNSWLIAKGYKRQNFVLTAFAMDMAEYYPALVDRDSDTYVGSNAKKCLKMILPNMKNNEALRHLCDISGGKSKPYDMEDVACDFIRYIENFQSKDHLILNNNITYTNNVHK
jgi:hypothetical protein